MGAAGGGAREPGAEPVGILYPYKQGSLLALWRRHFMLLPFETVSHVMVGTCRGLAHLHAHHLIHRDVKPDNILIDWDNTVCLADFGWCRKTSEMMTPGVVTSTYRAPEIWFGSQTYDTSIDTWSCGVILLELLHGTPFPYEKKRPVLAHLEGLVGKITEETWPGCSKFPNYAATRALVDAMPPRPPPFSKPRRAAPTNGKDLAGKMLLTPSCMRITMRKALLHKFLQIGSHGDNGPVVDASARAIPNTSPGAIQEARSDSGGAETTAQEAEQQAQATGTTAQEAEQQEAEAQATGTTAQEAEAQATGTAAQAAEQPAQATGNRNSPSERTATQTSVKRPLRRFRRRIKGKQTLKSVYKLEPQSRPKRKPLAKAERLPHDPRDSLERMTMEVAAPTPVKPGALPTVGEDKGGRGAEHQKTPTPGSKRSADALQTSPVKAAKTEPDGQEWREGLQRGACKGRTCPLRSRAHNRLAWSKDCGYECRYAAESPHSLCKKCMCSHCSRPAETELGTCRSLTCVIPNLSPEWQAVRAFSKTLVSQDPVDLSEFLERAKKVDDIVLLSLLADAWEPAGVQCLGASFASMQRKAYRAADVRVAFEKAFHAVSASSSEGFPWDDPRRSYLKLLAHAGACRHFGFLSLGKRLGLLSTSSGVSGPAAANKNKLFLGLGGNAQEYVKSDAVLTNPLRTQEWARTCWGQAKRAAQEQQTQEVISALQRYVFYSGVPTALQWGRATNYHGDHIVRKLFLCVWTLRGQWPMSRPDVQRLGADAGQHLRALPRMFDGVRLKSAFSPVSPSKLPMWTCLLHYAFEKVAGFREAFAKQDVTTDLWARATKIVQTKFGHPGHPGQVATVCMHMLREEPVDWDALLSRAGELRARTTLKGSAI